MEKLHSKKDTKVRSSAIDVKKKLSIDGTKDKEIDEQKVVVNWTQVEKWFRSLEEPDQDTLIGFLINIRSRQHEKRRAEKISCKCMERPRSKNKSA